MIHKSIRTTLSGLLVLIALNADASGFDGPYGVGLLSMGRAETRLQGFNPDTTVSSGAFNGTLGLGYSKNLGAINLAGELSAGLGNQRAGALSGEDFSGKWHDQFKIKRLMGISLQPGLYLNADTLAYAKFSVNRATGENTYDYGVTDRGSVTKSHQGLGVGVGLRHRINDQIDAVAEVQQIRLSSERYWQDTQETYRPSFFTFSVGLAVRF